MATVKGATREGVAYTGKTRVDITEIAAQVREHRQELQNRAENLVEGSILRIRELRLAGMINKAGADHVCNDLILALQALEEMG